MATGVSATGLKSFRVGVSGLMGTGLMMEDRKIRGTTTWDGGRLKMSGWSHTRPGPRHSSDRGDSRKTMSAGNKRVSHHN